MESSLAIKLGFDVKKLTALLIVLFLFISYIGLTLETYDEGKKYMEGWCARQRYGWDGAISWIKNNTNSNEIIASVCGDYFSWYTDRETVFLWALSEKNMSTLLEIIKMRKVNYLVVDELFTWHFNDLEMLYEFPDTFLGSRVVYSASTTDGRKTIIYNVTNIAYGNLKTYMLEFNWTELKNWTPLLYYSNGNISASKDGVQFDLEVARTPWPSGGVFFEFPSVIDISKYSYLEFWIKLPYESKNLVVEIHSVHGYSEYETNYYSYSATNITNNQWTKIVFQLKQYTGVHGDPNLKNVDKLAFIVGKFDVGENLTFWMRDLKFIGQEFGW